MSETRILSVEAIENIQQLKDNIKALKAEVDTLTVGSEQYNQKVLALAENQRALKLAMTGVYGSMKEVAAASKMDTDAINSTVEAAKQGTATYNEMSSALSQLKKEIKDVPKYLSEQAQAMGEVNPKYSALNEQIKVLDGSLKSLDADNGVFTRNVGNYKGALEEWGGTMGELKNVGNDLMGGFMSLLAVMNLFGADTEETKNSLQALVPIIGVLNAGKGLGGLIKVLPKAAAGQQALAAASAANAAAETANAAATTTATVATEGQTVAQEALNKSMLANPVLALIAGITALIGVVAKYVSNANKAAKETKDWAKQEEELNKKFDEQTANLDREQKILAAQGVSNQVLLAQKKEQIIAQKAETQALVQNITARLNQMKADSAWVRFWKGENKQIKNLEEQLKGLTEQMKGFDNAIADINTDIQVDIINQGKDAAKKYAEVQKNEIKAAVSVANDAIKSQRTELQAINAEYENNANILQSGLTAAQNYLSKATKGTKEYAQAQKDLDTIEKGVIANQERYNKTLADFNSKEYGETIVKYTKEIAYNLKSNMSDVERLMNSVLGFSDAMQGEMTIFLSSLSATSVEEAEKALNKFELKASTTAQNLYNLYNKLGDILEKDVKRYAHFNGELADLNVSGLSWETMLSLAETDADRLAANVGEPLATAIGKWAKNSENLKNAGYTVLQESFAQGMSLFNDAISANDADLAKIWRDKIKALFQETFKDDSEMSAIIQAFIIDLNKKIDEVIGDDKYTLNFGEKFSALMSWSGISNDFEAILKIADDFNQGYVESTANALNAVADLWETHIKLKYKKFVEEGKMTEEQAEEMAKKEFETVKGLQMGVAAINTAASVVGALAEVSRGVPYYVAIANAIAAAAEGAAQLMTISMTEFGKPSVNTPKASSSTPTYTAEPSQTVYAYAINPMDYAEAQAQTPIKAYVVDQDLAEGLNNYNNRNDETTF